MILNLMEEKPLPVYGDGKNVRDWLYVIDHCDALIRVIEQGRPGETYNIGGDAERQNIEVVNLLCKLFDSRLDRSAEKASQRLIRFVTDRPGHDLRYAIDAGKIKRELMILKNRLQPLWIGIYITWTGLSSCAVGNIVSGLRSTTSIDKSRLESRSHRSCMK
jgi:dTDP-D-glucose 4,6-dehydratase